MVWPCVTFDFRCWSTAQILHPTLRSMLGRAWQTLLWPGTWPLTSARNTCTCWQETGWVQVHHFITVFIYIYYGIYISIYSIYCSFFGSHVGYVWESALIQIVTWHFWRKCSAKEAFPVKFNIFSEISQLLWVDIFPWDTWLTLWRRQH